jgi:pantetheine-phosphate adenylyltransferase
MSDLRWMYISSTNIKNVASLGGNVRGVVPDSVIPRLRRAYGLPEDWPDSKDCECSPAFEDCSALARG